MLFRALDALAFSSLWLGSAAGALCGAVSLALGAAPLPAAVGIAVAGTLVVYNVDRLRDLDRDRATTPLRTAFVAEHARFLRGLVGVAAVCSVGFAVTLGAPVLALLAIILGLGLFHRRLKRFVVLKPLYITTAWLGVVVGVPTLAIDTNGQGVWVTGMLATAFFANAVASNIRDEEGAVPRLGAGRALWIARVLAGLGCLLGAAAPSSVRPLAAVPLATLGALLPFDPGERYGLVVVDGALLAGALVALALLAVAA